MVAIKVTNVATREVMYIEMSEDQSVRQLKSHIEGRGMGPVHRQQLAHAGRILTDDMTICSSGVASIPSVVLSVRKDISDPTVGAMSMMTGNSGNSLDHMPPAFTTYTSPVVHVSDEDESNSEVQDAQDDIPTCRICHGNKCGYE